MNKANHVVVGQCGRSRGLCWRRTYRGIFAPRLKIRKGLAALAPGIEEFVHFMRRHDEGGWAPMTSDGDNLALHGIKELAEPVLSLS